MGWYSYTLSGVVIRWATWPVAGAPRPVWPWIEQVNTLGVPATPFSYTQSEAGQLEGGGEVEQFEVYTLVYICTQFVYCTLSANRRIVVGPLSIKFTH